MNYDLITWVGRHGLLFHASLPCATTKFFSRLISDDTIIAVTRHFHTSRNFLLIYSHQCLWCNAFRQMPLFISAIMRNYISSRRAGFWLFEFLGFPSPPLHKLSAMLNFTKDIIFLLFWFKVYWRIACHCLIESERLVIAKMACIIIDMLWQWWWDIGMASSSLILFDLIILHLSILLRNTKKTFCCICIIWFYARAWYCRVYHIS